MILLLCYFYLLLPFNFALNPTPSIDLPVVRLLIIGLFFFFVAGSLLRKRFFMNISFPILALLAWFFWGGISYMWSLDPSWSYRKIFFLANFLLFFFVLLGQKADFLRKILKWYVFGAVSIAVIAVFQSLSQIFVEPGIVLHFWTEKILPFFLGSNFSSSVATYPSLLANVGGKTYLRATGLFPDPHIFSYYVAMALPFGVLYWKKRIFLSWSHIGILFLSVGFLLSFSRGGYVAITLCFFWFLVLSFFSHKKQKIALLTVVTGIFFMAMLISPIGTRFVSSFIAGDGSRSERLELAYQAVEAIKERPFLGVGIGNYPLWVKPEAEAREPIYAHNMYLDIATELGLLGLILFLIALFGALWASFRKWYSTDDASYLAAHIALVYFFGHGFFEAPIFSIHVLPVFLLLVAFCFAKNDDREYL